MSAAMPTLAETQRRLQHWILQEPQAALHDLVSGERSQIAQRAGVYHAAYRLRLDDVLRNDYPLLAAVTGEGFADIASRYRQAHPSQHPSARWYGQHLHAMLGRSGIADLARLEWTMGMAFDAADADSIVLEDLYGLAADAWAALSFEFHPSLQLLSLNADLAPLLAGGVPASPVPIESLTEVEGAVRTDACK